MRATLAVFGTVLLAPLAGAQSSATAVPAARGLPAPSIVSPRFVGAATNVLPLSNGTLLINDTRNHRVMLSDSLLHTTSVVIDSTEYGNRPASLMRYPGDSVLFIENITPAMMMIDPRGKVVRTMGVPRPRDAGWLMPTPYNIPGVDSRGRLVHRGITPRINPPPIKPSEQRYKTYPDTDPIIRDDPVTHTGDTLAWTKGLDISGIEIARPDGRSIFYARSSPVEVVDQFVVRSDGNVAIVRGRDYHIDVIDATGKMTALPKIPYAWEHISDDQKMMLIDSLRQLREERDKRPRQTTSMTGGTTGGSGGSSGGGGGGLGVPGLGDFPPAPPGALDMKPSEIPDYRGVFNIGAVRADAENNVWIRNVFRGADTTFAVWDVIDAKGTRVDRILVPTNRGMAGFDKNGNMFLVGREEGGVQFIERVRWRK